MSERKTEILLSELSGGWVAASDLCFQLGWAPHTLRGVISRLNTVSSNSGQGKRIEMMRQNGITRYRIATLEAAE